MLARITGMLEGWDGHYFTQGLWSAVRYSKIGN